jgi:choline dehydrogenase-like flavoprotein
MLPEPPMITDFRSAEVPAEFTTDICIVGSGAAGLTVACHVGGRLRVLVVEAGDRDPGPDDADWLAGETTDFAFDGLTSGRVRAFGGATRRWFGQCIRLDPMDFEQRAWVPYSGWPIIAQDLEAYYDRAERFLGIAPHRYGGENWSRFGLKNPGFGNDGVIPKFTIYCPEPDFTKAFGRQLTRDTSAVDILLNAAAVGIALDRDGRRVTGLRLRGGDRQGVVRARAYVLCGGGIENPRLMLASNDVMAEGVGNAHGLVGRFFQDHPGGTTGVLATSWPRKVQEQFRKLRRGGLTFWPKVALTAAAQRQGRYLNANAQMSYGYAEDSALTRAKEAIAAVSSRRAWPAAVAGLRLVRHTPELISQAVHTMATGKAPVFEPNRVMLTAHVEQLPDPENRVTLACQCDRFGVPRARLTWRVNREEVRTLRGITEAVGQALHRLDFGEMTLAPWLKENAGTQPELVDTYHHAGTIRMAETPRDGVVDPDCRVFGIDNLYVAGSSVFPTSGYANPTLTIVALAIRLSDALKKRIAPA